MKKLFLICLLFLTGSFATSIVAQNATSDEETTKTAKNIEKEAEELTKKMTKAYKLTEDQASTLMMLNKKRAEDLAQIDSMFSDKTLSAKEAKAELIKLRQEIQANYQSMIKDIFNEKQYAKYLEDEEENREKIQGNVNWMFNMAANRNGASNVNLLGWNGDVADSLKIAQEATDRLVRKYKLTAEQTEKVLALNIAEISAEIAERRNVNLDGLNPTEWAEKQQEIQTMAKRRSDNYERYLKEIMTEEQYKKYTNGKKARESRNSSRFRRW